LVIDGNFAAYAMPKKHLSIFLVILLTLLLIAVPSGYLRKGLKALN
jgi:hypothetical protein